MKTRTISIKNLNSDTYSVKDDSPRGIKTVSKSEIKIGDKIVIDNYFHTVTK